VKTLQDLVEEARLDVEEINIQQFSDLQERQPTLLILDVRELQEFSQGHIPGAVLLPRGILELAVAGVRQPTLSAYREKTVLVVCDSGTRSLLAAFTLQQMGFDSVYVLLGGMQSWQAEDLPMDTGL
jgi:rhodanese-related sulfurtransferase